MERYSPYPAQELYSAPSLSLEHKFLERNGNRPTSTPPARFVTPWGLLPFEDIYQRTRRYTAHILHHTFYMQEVDDGLQSRLSGLVAAAPGRASNPRR